MDKIDNNSILFIGLSNEYCNLIENVTEFEKEELIDKLIKILPRLYISMSDIELTENDEYIYIEPHLEEIYYDSVRRKMEGIFGEDDTYLEVFEEDMKFSETPIAASISECLADIFQYQYDFIHSVKDAPQSHIKDFINVCRENFEAYWGQTLCNVLRALHNIKYHADNI